MIVEPTFELESSVERTAEAPFAPVIGSTASMAQSIVGKS